ncbi:MAG: hypothetical protein ACKPKO_37010, partial [Candidatus Fonsibacter sp.]
MENATTTEPISEEAAAKHKRIDELRKYSRDYYHAHKKASECEHNKKTFSSVSALRRHQSKISSASCCKLRRPLRSSERKRINNCLYSLNPSEYGFVRRNLQ